MDRDVLYPYRYQGSPAPKNILVFLCVPKLFVLELRKSVAD